MLKNKNGFNLKFQKNDFNYLMNIINTEIQKTPQI
jgi:hypothetical protein